MALYLFSPDGTPIKPVPARGHFKLPNGDRVSPIVEGWVASDGHYFADYAPPEPPGPTEAEKLAAFRRDASITQFQAHYTLYAWGILDDVIAKVEAQGRPMTIIFEKAGTWNRRSPTLQAMFTTIKLPDGSPITPEVLDQFFRDAAAVEV